MQITININDPDLEARVDAFYQAQKLKGESLDTFTGRVLLGQMVSTELSDALKAKQDTMAADLQAIQQDIVKSGEETIKSWAKGAETVETK